MHEEYPHNQFFHRLRSLIWASGLIPLDCLYLRPLQQHFHSLGLTNRFTPLRRLDPLVLANLLSQWQDLSFLPIESPSDLFRRSSRFLRTPLPRVGAPRWGIPRFGVLDPFRPQAPHQHFGAQGGNFGPPSLGFSFTGPPTYDRYRQHYICSLY